MRHCTAEAVARAINRPRGHQSQPVPPRCRQGSRARRTRRRRSHLAGAIQVHPRRRRRSKCPPAARAKARARAHPRRELSPLPPTPPPDRATVPQAKQRRRWGLPSAAHATGRATLPVPDSAPARAIRPSANAAARPSQPFTHHAAARTILPLPHTPHSQSRMHHQTPRRRMHVPRHTLSAQSDPAQPAIRHHRPPSDCLAFSSRAAMMGGRHCHGCKKVARSPRLISQAARKNKEAHGDGAPCLMSSSPSARPTADFFHSLMRTPLITAAWWDSATCLNFIPCYSPHLGIAE
jgi:hypothetical protein